MNGKRVYAMEFGSEIVKIGVSQNVAQRMREVQRQYGKKVKRVAYTEPLPRDFAYCLEWCVHSDLMSRQRFQGKPECFNVSFKDACAAIKTYSGQMIVAFFDVRFACAAAFYMKEDVHRKTVARSMCTGALNDILSLWVAPWWLNLMSEDEFDRQLLTFGSEIDRGEYQLTPEEVKIGARIRKQSLIIEKAKSKPPVRQKRPV